MRKLFYCTFVFLLFIGCANQDYEKIIGTWKVEALTNDEINYMNYLRFATIVFTDKQDFAECAIFDRPSDKSLMNTFDDNGDKGYKFYQRWDFSDKSWEPIQYSIDGIWILGKDHNIKITCLLGEGILYGVYKIDGDTMTIKGKIGKRLFNLVLSKYSNSTL